MEKLKEELRSQNFRRGGQAEVGAGGRGRCSPDPELCDHICGMRLDFGLCFSSLSSDFHATLNQGQFYPARTFGNVETFLVVAAGEVLLASGGYRPGVLLTIVQHVE